MMPQVNIHMPWKLVIGDHCWIGYGCQILNFEPVVLENHVALAHQVYVAAANHDYKDHRMPYRNAPITICRGSWIGTRAFIGPGLQSESTVS
jgi:putative colanic acid biosynthesis acetyltransferase WcaF